LLPSLAVASATAGVIHATVCPSHFQESDLYGVFFLLAAAGQLGFAVVVLGRPSRTVLRTGAAATAAVLMLWLATRTVGIPPGPAAGRTEDVGVLDLMATGAETVVVVLCLLGLRA
jgi:hypothetical protein